MKSRETEGCIFCAIAAGRETAHKVFEDEQFLAFLGPSSALSGPRTAHPEIAYHDMDGSAG